MGEDLCVHFEGPGFSGGRMVGSRMGVEFEAQVADASTHAGGGLVSRSEGRDGRLKGVGDQFGAGAGEGDAGLAVDEGDPRGAASQGDVTGVMGGRSD